MPRRVSSFVLPFVLLFVPTAAFAQEAGKVGITMGFPQSVGVLWHLSDKVAIRPELSFAWSSSETGSAEAEGDAFGTGISALFYLRKWDSLSTYVSPRYSFGRSNTTSGGFSGDLERTSRNHFVSGSFGAQYWAGSRFSVFGEVGLSYQRTTSELDAPAPPFETETSETSTRTFGTRSSVGVAFYF